MKVIVELTEGGGVSLTVEEVTSITHPRINLEILGALEIARASIIAGRWGIPSDSPGYNGTVGTLDPEETQP